jgi:predicted DNA-binding transcriptional regulator AlpA
VARKVSVDDLVSAEDIAERLDLSHPQNVSVWARRHADFPAPVKKLRRVSIWDWTEVEAWAKATGRLDNRGQPITPSTDPTQKRKRAQHGEAPQLKEPN